MGIQTNIRSLITRASSNSIVIHHHHVRHTHPFSLPTYFLPYPSAAALKGYTSSGGGREKGGDNNIIDDDDGTIEEEIVRAPSLAEEFKRLEHEKVEEGGDIEEATEQGLASQTVDKTAEGLDEAAVGGNGKGDDHLQESVKTRYKEHEPDADYRRRGHN